jgi:hypothetical protein
VTEIDFTDLAQKVRKRLDEVFVEDKGAARGFGEPRGGLAPSLAKAGRLAAALEWKVPRHTVRELAAELRRLQARFPADHHVAPLIKVQLELCRYIEGRHARIDPEAPMLLLKSFDIMMRMAEDPQMPAAEKERATRRVLADYSALKARLSPSRSRAAEAIRPGAAAPAQAAGHRRRAAPCCGSGAASVPKSRAYYLIPASHLKELTRFIEQEVEDLHAAISQLTPRSS